MAQLHRNHTPKPIKSTKNKLQPKPQSARADKRISTGNVFAKAARFGKIKKSRKTRIKAKLARQITQEDLYKKKKDALKKVKTPKKALMNTDVLKSYNLKKSPRPNSNRNVRSSMPPLNHNLSPSNSPNFQNINKYKDCAVTSMFDTLSSFINQNDNDVIHSNNKTKIYLNKPKHIQNKSRKEIAISLIDVRNNLKKSKSFEKPDKDGDKHKDDDKPIFDIKLKKSKSAENNVVKDEPKPEFIGIKLNKVKSNDDHSDVDITDNSTPKSTNIAHPLGLVVSGSNSNSTIEDNNLAPKHINIDGYRRWSASADDDSELDDISSGTHSNRSGSVGSSNQNTPSTSNKTTLIQKLIIKENDDIQTKNNKNDVINSDNIVIKVDKPVRVAVPEPMDDDMDDMQDAMNDELDFIDMTDDDDMMSYVDTGNDNDNNDDIDANQEEEKLSSPIGDHKNQFDPFDIYQSQPSPKYYTDNDKNKSSSSSNQSSTDYDSETDEFDQYKYNNTHSSTDSDDSDAGYSLKHKVSRKHFKTISLDTSENGDTFSMHSKDYSYSNIISGFTVNTGTNIVNKTNKSVPPTTPTYASNNKKKKSPPRAVSAMSGQTFDYNRYFGGGKVIIGAITTPKFAQKKKQQLNKKRLSKTPDLTPSNSNKDIKAFLLDSDQIDIEKQLHDRYDMITPKNKGNFINFDNVMVDSDESNYSGSEFSEDMSDYDGSRSDYTDSRSFTGTDDGSYYSDGSYTDDVPNDKNDNDNDKKDASDIDTNDNDGKDQDDDQVKQPVNKMYNLKIHTKKNSKLNVLNEDKGKSDYDTDARDDKDDNKDKSDDDGDDKDDKDDKDDNCDKPDDDIKDVSDANLPDVFFPNNSDSESEPPVPQPSNFEKVRKEEQEFKDNRKQDGINAMSVFFDYDDDDEFSNHSKSQWDEYKKLKQLRQDNMNRDNDIADDIDDIDNDNVSDSDDNLLDISNSKDISSSPSPQEPVPMDTPMRRTASQVVRNNNLMMDVLLGDLDDDDDMFYDDNNHNNNDDNIDVDNDNNIDDNDVDNGNNNQISDIDNKQQQDEESEESEEELDMTTIKELLKEFRLSSNSKLKKYLKKELKIKYAREIVNCLPTQVLKPPRHVASKLKVLKILNKLGKHVASKVINNLWDGDHASKWAGLISNQVHQIYTPIAPITKAINMKSTCLTPTILFEQAVNSNNNGIDDMCNKIQLVGHRQQYIDKIININELYSVTIQIDQLPDLHIKECDIINIGVMFIDGNKQRIYITDRLEIRLNDLHHKSLFMGSFVENTSEIEIIINNCGLKPIVSFAHRSKGHQSKKQNYNNEFILDNLIKPSKAKLYIEQYAGEGIYSIKQPVDVPDNNENINTNNQITPYNNDNNDNDNALNVNVNVDNDNKSWKCINCKEINYIKHKFCPECGTKR